MIIVKPPGWEDVGFKILTETIVEHMFPTDAGHVKLKGANRLLFYCLY